MNTDTCTTIVCTTDAHAVSVIKDCWAMGLPIAEVAPIVGRTATYIAKVYGDMNNLLPQCAHD